MRFICYPTSHVRPKIVAAPLQRTWMDRTSSRFAYRCLPLNMANMHGWMILNETPFVARWNGHAEVSSVSVHAVEDDGRLLATSHFGEGVLTFHINGIFETEPGYDLYVGGPINALKDGIQPLAGMVETDWLPFSFTMNWRFTRPNHGVAFERDEPFCMIFPVKRGLLEECEPQFRSLEDNPQLQQAYRESAQGRRRFIEELSIPDSQAQKDKWQKDYMKGVMASVAAPDHQNKLKLRDFEP